VLAFDFTLIATSNARRYLTVAFVGYGFGATRGLENAHNTTVSSLNMYSLSTSMKSLFGERWKEAWEAMSDSLYQDSVIALDDLRQLKAAAAAVDAAVSAAVDATQAAATAAVAAYDDDVGVDPYEVNVELENKQAIATAMVRS